VLNEVPVKLKLQTAPLLRRVENCRLYFIIAIIIYLNFYLFFNHIVQIVIITNIIIKLFAKVSPNYSVQRVYM